MPEKFIEIGNAAPVGIFSVAQGSGDDEALHRAVVVLTTSRSDTDQTAAHQRHVAGYIAMRNGVYDYVPNHERYADRLLPMVQKDLRWATTQAQLFEAERQLRRRSLYDTLTDLPNRNLFFDRLEHACGNTLRYQIPFAVLMMDLDRFKDVNDTLGHAAGDQLLQHVGKRLFATCRHSDTISRLSSDKFAAICLGIATPEAAATLAEKLLEALKPPIIIDGKTLAVGISIGIALCPATDTEPGALLAAADKALCQSKGGRQKLSQAGINPVYSAADPPHVMLSELELAITNHEFIMFYQPKINLQTAQIVGVEALMRWKPPTGNMVDPDHFIPVVENSSLLRKFTLMSIDLVLTQMSEWATRGIALNVALNISAKMLEDAILAQHLEQKLSSAGVPPQLLTLEITETAIILNRDAARNVAAQITDIGIKLSIDDFGAGFTSFTYLREFSTREIKIDKNFIMDLKPNSFGASVVRCFSTFCESEGITLVAEGVEQLETWSLLCELGCHIGQGYSIARPASAFDFEAWLKDAKGKQAVAF